MDQRKALPFSGDLGWYGGDDFALLDFGIPEISEDGTFISLISLQIAKFLVSLNVSKDN